MSGQALVDELRAAGTPSNTINLLLDRAADTIEALEAAVDTWTEMAARRHRALGEVEASYREAIARAERAEQKSAELAAVITEIRAAWDDVTWEEYAKAVIRIVRAVPADVLSAYTTRIREEAWAQGHSAGRAANPSVPLEANPWSEIPEGQG